MIVVKARVHCLHSGNTLLSMGVFKSVQQYKVKTNKFRIWEG